MDKSAWGALLSGVGGLLAGGAAVATFWYTKSHDSVPKPSPSASVSPAVPVLRLARPNNAMDFCSDFIGTGVIPRGSALLIFDRDLSESNTPYWFNKEASNNDAGWVAANVQIGDGQGDDGKKVEISAVLVDDSIGRFIESIGAESVDGWHSSRLPGDAIDHMTITRNKDAKPCP